MKPRLLDLGCGPGGCTAGYQDAGFYVVGVDLHPQPYYCGDEFHQADMLTYPLDGFDAIHASPPCQHFARVTAWRGSRGSHPDLLTPMIKRLATQWTPWVIENVPEAIEQPSLMLCGSMFGLRVRRHRHFLSPWLGNTPPGVCRHEGLLPFMHKGERAYADAMECEWMSNKASRQAIPPAYTEFIGTQLLQHITRTNAA